MAIAQRIRLQIKAPTTLHLKYMPFASGYLLLIAKRPKITILSLSSIAISLPIDKLDLALGVL